MHHRHESHGRGGKPSPRHAYYRHRPRHRRGRGGPRARRGDIRAAVLALLAERQMHGYEMIQELEERTKGVWKPSAGSVYPTLQLLEEEGLIRGTEADGKRRFELTDDGRKAQEAHEGDAPWDQVTSGLEPEVFRLKRSVRAARRFGRPGIRRRRRKPAGQDPRATRRNPKEGLRHPRRGLQPTPATLGRVSGVELKKQGGFAYREAGPAGEETGDAVVCVHGFPESSRMWEPLMAELAAAGRRSVAPDLYGLGDSPDDSPDHLRAQPRGLHRRSSP